MMLAGALIAKYVAGVRTQAAISASVATSDSVSMAPYPIKRASDSRSSSFGVVPDEISEWNPEMAPQAMVIKQNGKTFPAKTGPEPSMNLVIAGIWSGGSTNRTPTASAATTPIYTNADR